MYAHTLFHILSLLLLSFSLSIWLQLNSKGIVSSLALYISAAALLVSIFGLFQLSQHAETIFTTYRVRSTLGQPNKLAFYLIATLPVSISLIFEREIYARILGIASSCFSYSFASWQKSR